MAHVGIRPGAAALVAARVRVKRKDGQLRTVFIEDVVDQHVGRVDGQVGALLEREAIQLACSKEHALGQHAVHFKVRFQLRLVEVIAFGAHLVAIEGPVGGTHLEAAFACIDDLLDIVRFTARIDDGRLRQLAQQGVHGGRVVRRLVFQRIRRVVRVTHQRGTFGAQFCQFQHFLGVVELAATAAARLRGGHDAFAQGAVGQQRQRRLARRVDEGDHVFAVQAALLGQAGSHFDGGRRQAVQLFARVDNDGRGVQFLQHVLRELGRQGSELAVVGAQLFLVRGRQLGAGAHEVRVIALEQAFRFGIEAQLVALGVQGIDALEEFVIEHDRIAMGRHFRRQLAFQALDRVIRIRAGHHGKHGAYTAQQLARALHGHDGVVERGRFLVVRNRTDFRQVGGHACRKGGRVVGVLHLVERRIVEWQAARLRKRVRGGQCCRRGSGGGKNGGGWRQHQAGGDDEHCWTGHVFFQETQESRDCVAGQPEIITA
ncbi:hypothetical protein D3C72_876100 [compost metagenome]